VVNRLRNDALVEVLRMFYCQEQGWVLGVILGYVEPVFTGRKHCERRRWA